MSDLNKTLADRQKTHGDFQQVAKVAESLMNSIEFQRLSASQSFAVRMIVGKLARIVCGNPDEPDHWHDIAGYARLVEDGLINSGNEKKEAVKSVNKNPLWRLRMIMLERLILFVHSVDNRFCKTEDANSEREIVFVTDVSNVEYIANKINNDAYVMGLKIESHSIEAKNTEEEPYLSYRCLYGIAQPILVRIKFGELNQ